MGYHKKNLSSPFPRGTAKCLNQPQSFLTHLFEANIDSILDFFNLQKNLLTTLTNEFSGAQDI